LKVSQQQINGPEWDSKLFHDLDYIKTKLRYPIGRKVFLPGIVGAAIFILVLLLTYSTFAASSAHPEVTPVFIAATTCIIALLLANKFFRELKFMPIPTAFDAKRNQQLIDAFLQSRHMIVFRHPEAAEVFQIVSKNINPLKEQREVLVFIADDNRILINSHFTNAGFSLAPGGRHHKQMAAELKAFAERS